MLRYRTLAHAAAVVSALCLLPTAANATWPHEPGNGGVPVCTATGGQTKVAGVSDGAGGAIFVWQDPRGGVALDLYAQRVSAAGVPLWTANGVAVCTATGDQNTPKIIADGAGGAIITWMDSRGGATPDIYAQRLNSAGVPQWTANGVAVCTAANNQFNPDLTTDGAGGAIITWYDKRNGVDYSIYAQRVLANGTRFWSTDGASICLATNAQYFPVPISDGAGGAVIAWQDARGGANFDIYAQRVNGSSATLWTADGVALCTAANDQLEPAIVTDGAGGAVVTWTDVRTGGVLVYAQRVNGTGTPVWSSNGESVSPLTTEQRNPAIASDGGGGAFIVWEDARTSTIPNIYGQRFNAGGARQWGSSGLAVCNGSSDQTEPSLVPDGAGGILATWNDLRDGHHLDVYAHRLASSGQILWPLDGKEVCSAALDQYAAAIVSDGANGAILCWLDTRSGVSDFYCQRVERFGELGSPEPVIAKIRDIPNDQGGQVKLSWFGSYLDADPTYRIDYYSIWRSTPAAAVQQALRSGARLVGPSDEIPAGPGRTFTSSVEGAQTIFWEWLAYQPAVGDSGYSYVASTTGDSIAAANPRTIFRVQAHSVNGIGLWSSAADSGYSVDNLPPAAPAQFTAYSNAGTVSLLWHVSPEGDFARYQLHRGTSAGFVPGPGSLLATPTDPGFVGPAGQPYTYKLAAEDVHGNLSAFAVVQTGVTTAVGDGGAPTVAFLGLPSPNPARVGTAMRFGLPAAARVTLTLYDQQGRQIRELVADDLPAGEHVARWDGRDRTGRPAPSGLYFARMRVAGQTFTQRIITMQ